MAAFSSNHPQSVTDLVTFLFNRRETLLNNWRTACEADASLKKISTLTREEFNNLIPSILESLEQQLMGQPVQTDPVLAAKSHGLQRWQKSLSLVNLLSEYNHLLMALFNELKLFRQVFPQSDPDIVLQAQQHIMLLMTQTLGGSVVKHDELQRLEAANRAASLEAALQGMEDLARQRGDMLRTSSHDLRSGLGLSIGAASILQMDDLSSEERQQYIDMLNRNLARVQSLLTGLMDLARLEAGREPLDIEEFDVASLLTELVDSAQPMAQENGIILRADGLEALLVKTDRLKIHRIAQNLLVNALIYTPSSSSRPGMVSVSWSAENDWRWVFSVQDSGPGLPAGVMDLFHKQLRPTVEPTSVLSPEEAQPIEPMPNSRQDLPADPLRGERANAYGKHGEGVGLQIVKRLCESVGASVEIESVAGRGTLVRVRMLMQQPV
ncbi:sensor histidine kinase [Spirosoma radiotolerans]|uniref:histidine kinase n=1 Tax=Spirosoma radiotolerans TaxID=1379870 RepID=A0A0E3ZUZ3_9BACT|nr:HAMP domain-containing sensor histidine kinase [Spirosoma radiotolerans]AKD54813.1 histidine kinase [Spirosoma radiotolerans]